MIIFEVGFWIAFRNYKKKRATTTSNSNSYTYNKYNYLLKDVDNIQILIFLCYLANICFTP